MLLFDREISIPAPTKGATLLNPANNELTIDFNPRTHEGCDNEEHGKGMEEPDFNPRTHEGCDNTGSVLGRTGNDFNPRTHEGCD